jgi:hypothetical protein
MPVYTVHEPPLKQYEAVVDPERFKFVRDGFSFWAFLLTPFWMLRHRMWLVLLGYVLLIVVLEIALYLVGASAGARVLVSVLVSILIGLEAGTLRRFTLGRAGWTDVGLVGGNNLEAAERRFFDIWIGRDAAAAAASPPPTPSAPPRVAAAVPDVIGLFPQPGAQR